ncbi:MAG TPA: hypothetical protein VK524_09060, partial [Polyangiaceae bacterium]|nr:hypothetical protein [Polyangiaceae bacterium]
GLEGAMLTVPLVPRGYRAPYATVSGTLEGWETLQPSGAGRYLRAVFEHSRRPDLDSLDTAVDRDGSEQVECIKREGSEPCNFSLRVPVSRHTVFVTIAEADAHGTTNDVTDDTFSVVSLGLAANLNLTAGGTTQGLRLPVRVSGTLGRVTVNPTRAPSLPVSVVGLPGINVGGEILLFDAFPSAPEFLVPARSEWPDAKLWSVATATDAASDTRLRSFVRGVPPPEAGEGAVLQSGALREAPSVGSVAPGGITLAGADGLVQVRGYEADELVLEAILLGSARELEFPAGTAPDSLTVTLYEAPLDPREMSLQAVRETAASLSERTIAP